MGRWCVVCSDDGNNQTQSSTDARRHLQRFSRFSGKLAAVASGPPTKLSHVSCYVGRTSVRLPLAPAADGLPLLCFYSCSFLMLSGRALGRISSVSRHLARTMATASETGSSANARPTEVPTETKVTFPVSKIPPNPLGEGRYIKTAAALIIGYGFLLT